LSGLHRNDTVYKASCPTIPAFSRIM